MRENWTAIFDSWNPFGKIIFFLNLIYSLCMAFSPCCCHRYICVLQILAATIALFLELSPYLSQHDEMGLITSIFFFLAGGLAKKKKKHPQIPDFPRIHVTLSLSSLALFNGVLLFMHFSFKLLLSLLSWIVSKPDKQPFWSLCDAPRCAARISLGQFPLVGRT